MIRLMITDTQKYLKANGNLTKRLRIFTVGIVVSSQNRLLIVKMRS